MLSTAAVSQGVLEVLYVFHFSGLNTDVLAPV